MRSLPLIMSTALLAACGFSSEKGIHVYNEAPAVTIIEPLQGEIFNEGDNVRFLGEVNDDEDAQDLQLEWTSSIDGVLMDSEVADQDGFITFDSAILSVGTHIIAFKGTDGGLQQGEATVEIEVADVPDIPSIDFTRPLQGDVGVDGQSFVFAVTVSDPTDFAEDLIVELSSSPGGLICTMLPDSGGDADCDAILPLGSYVLTAIVEDTEGNTASDQTDYDVIDPDDYDADGDGFTSNGGDCDDSNHTIYPGAPEVCDGLDNDCNNVTAIDVGTECYDDDGDTFCEAPPCVNSSQTLIDCDDTNTAISPWGVETANGVDDDCDGTIDEGTSVYDDDLDGYCETPPCVNTANLETDCNDGDALIFPTQIEDCGTLHDDNCNGQTDEQDATGCSNFYEDYDGDTYGVPGTPQCWCGTAAYPYTGLDTNDCYDNNADARPTQTAYFSSSRGDGSYDYDCSGSEDQLYFGTGSCVSSSIIDCDLNPEGWQSTVPACGQGGNYVDGCDFDEFGFILGCSTCALGIIDPSLFAFCANCLTDYCDQEVTAKTQTCR
jgi:hypothetical protein